MSLFKKRLSMVLAMALLVVSVSVTGNTVDAAKKKASLATKKMTVTVGKKAKISIRNKKSSSKYTFKTSAKKVATVSSKGVVKGIKAGTAKITVKEVTKKNKKKRTRTLGKVKITVKKAKKKVVAPVVTPTPAASEAPVATTEPTATPKPTAKPVVITHEDFEYEGLNKEKLDAIDKSKKLVAFAFDDGPVAWRTDSTAKRIIDALTDNGQNGTFFFQGNHISSSTEKEILYAKEKGCEIGNHTQTHPNLTTLTTAKMQAEVEQCRAKLEALTGYKKFVVRPPFLSTNQKVLAAINVPLASCGVDSGDWNNGTYDSVMAKIRAAEASGALENAVVLMHENYDFTAQAVETLVPELMEKGYQIVSVSDLAYLKGVKLQSGYVYNYIK